MTGGGLAEDFAPEGINIDLKLPQVLLSFVGVILCLAGLLISFHHSVHVFTNLHTMSAEYVTTWTDVLEGCRSVRRMPEERTLLPC